MIRVILTRQQVYSEPPPNNNDPSYQWPNVPIDRYFHLPLSALVYVTITDKHVSDTDRNKNDPVFHFRLLRDTHAAAFPREEKPL